MVPAEDVAKEEVPDGSAVVGRVTVVSPKLTALFTATELIFLAILEVDLDVVC